MSVFIRPPETFAGFISATTLESRLKAVDGVSTPPLGFALEQEIISCSRARETA